MKGTAEGCRKESYIKMVTTDALLRPILSKPPICFVYCVAYLILPISLSDIYSLSLFILFELKSKVLFYTRGG